MKQKQIIERNLPLTDKYQLISIQRSNLFDVDIIQVCANCNAELVNFAEIANTSGKRFIVGLDCMETLTKALTNLSDYEFEKYAFNSALRFYLLMEKADKVKIRNGFIDIEYKDKKGNLQTKSEMEIALTNYNFDISRFQSELSEQEKQIQAI